MPTATAQQINITLRRPHAGQRVMLDSTARFRVVCAGRRFGKSVLAEHVLATGALAGRRVAYFAPTYRMLTVFWRSLIDTLYPIVARLNGSEHRAELITGGTVEAWSLSDPNTARGRSYGRVVIDEAAMVPGLLDAWTKVIRPTLADVQGDALILSTPRGRNDFAALYARGLAREGGWASFHAPTWGNPHIDPAEIAAMRAGMTQRAFAQEIAADFLDDGAGVFRRTADAATATPQQHAQPGHNYVFGVDWGRSGDYTVIAVYDLLLRAIVALDRFTDLSFAVQLDRLRALYARFQPTAIVAEQNSIGQPLIEQISGELPIVPFVTSNASKQVLIDALALAFENAAIVVLPDETLLGELQAYTQDRTASGLIRYGAPGGYHDDCVMAVAFAYHAAQSSGPLLLWGDDYGDSE